MHPDFVAALSEKRIVEGHAAALDAAQAMIACSAAFAVLPLPHDVSEFYMRPDAAERFDRVCDASEVITEPDEEESIAVRAGQMTDEQQQKYLVSGGTACPYCGSTNVASGDLHADGPIATSNAECKDCGKEWIDIYTLTDVDPADVDEEE